MKSTAGDGDGGTTTTLTNCVHQQRHTDHEDHPAQTSVVISRDLRRAIKLLRDVPHADVKRHGDADRLPFRPDVNQLSHRFSLPLPLQLPRHTDHLAVRQCSSMTDHVVHVTGN